MPPDRDGPGVERWWGRDVAAAGDVDADGFDDVIIAE